MSFDYYFYFILKFYLIAFTVYLLIVIGGSCEGIGICGNLHILISA